jgi:hypothetical protein
MHAQDAAKMTSHGVKLLEEAPGWLQDGRRKPPEKSANSYPGVLSTFSSLAFGFGFALNLDLAFITIGFVVCAGNVSVFQFQFPI